MPPETEIGDKHPPHHASYESAIDSVLNNKHINNMVFHDEDYYRVRMRQIQGTYKVQQTHWPNQGYGFRIRLIWDHDRLWGTFELGFFNGVFLIDPGPGQDHFQASDDYHHQHPDGETQPEGNDEQELDDPSEYREYALVWRGTSVKMPDTLFFSTMTVGKIRFGFNEIWGHFDAMVGVGLPNYRCEFHGERRPGPVVGSLSIQDVIDDWNHHGMFCEDESPRLSSSNRDKPKDERTNGSPHLDRKPHLRD